jgi:hypothetical protein
VDFQNPVSQKPRFQSPLPAPLPHQQSFVYADKQVTELPRSVDLDG